MVKNYQSRSARLTLFSLLSAVFNGALSLGKAIIALVTGSHFILISALYNVGMMSAKTYAYISLKASWKDAILNSSDKKAYIFKRNIGIILTLTGFCYVLYTALLPLFPRNNKETYLQIAITVALITFVEIGLSVYGMIKEQRYGDPITFSFRVSNFCSALISIVLTQTLLLQVGDKREVDHFIHNIICGIVFGSIALLIGLSLTIMSIKQISGKYVQRLTRSIYKKEKALSRSKKILVPSIETIEYDNVFRPHSLLIKLKDPSMMPHYTKYFSKYRLFYKISFYS